MTRKEYAEIAAGFARLARETEAWIVEVFVPESIEMGADAEDHAAQLDEYGFYMTGGEYLQALAAVELFEKLCGRNAARAVSDDG